MTTPNPPRSRPVRSVLGLGLAVALVGAASVLIVLAVRQKAGGPARANGSTGSRAAESIRAALDSAGVYQTQNDLPKAESVLWAAVQQWPTDQELRLALGEVLVARGEHAAAYEQYEKALAIGPRDATIEFSAGTLASMAGMPERAVEHYAMAQTADPTEPQIPLYLGQVQLRLGQVEEAKASLLRAANLDPDSAVAWGTLADVQLRENNVSLALQLIAKARALQPTVPTWRLIEARALKRDNQPERAVGTLLGVPPGERRDPAYLRLLAECYGMLERPGDAAAQYREASDALPSDAELAYEAARWLDLAGDRSAALGYAQRSADAGKPEAAALVERLSK